MKKVKQFLAVIITMVMTLLFSVSTVSAESVRAVTVVLDGHVVDFVDTYARIIHDYAYVPISKIIHTLTEETPNWDDISKMASFNFRGNHYKIYISQKGIYINEVFKEFDTGPEIVDDRTMIPLRMLSNALGFDANWDGAISTVTLKSPPEQPSLASVVSVTPARATATAGTTVTVNVITTNNASEVKIVDKGNNSVAQSRAFTVVGTQRQYQISFVPAAGGVYHVYAATDQGYNLNSPKELESKKFL